MSMTRAQILAQIAEARASMAALRKLYPGCFDKDGRPLVATLSMPRHSESSNQQEKLKCPNAVIKKK